MNEIQKPGLVQAQGGSFAVDYLPTKGSIGQVDIIGAGRRLYSAFTEQIIEPMKENAFMEGVTDSIAGQIEDRSWLTQDSYMQGVAYSNFGGKLNEASGKFTELARTSLDRGETVQEYNQRAQEVLAGLNSELDNMGLTGKARELAQKQILTTHTASMQSYQKEAEAATKLRIQQGAIQQTQGTVATITGSLTTNPNNAGAVHELLSANYDTLLETQKYINPDPLGYASARTVDAVSGMLSQLNPADPKDRQRFLSIQAGTDRMMEKLNPEDHAKLQAKYQEFTKTAQNAQNMERETLLMQRELEVASGTKPMTAEEVNDAVAGNIAAARAGTITVADAEAANARILSLYKQSANADSTGLYALSNPTMRMAAGVTDNAAANHLAKSIARSTGGDPEATGTQLIMAGVQSGNPEAVKEGYKVMYNQFGRLLGVDPDKISEQATEADNRAWRGYVQQLRREPAQARTAADFIQDPNTRSAVIAYITTNANEVGYDLTKDMREIQRLKNIYETQGKDGKLLIPKEAFFTEESFDRNLLSSNGVLAPSSFSTTPTVKGNFNPFSENVKSPVQIHQLNDMNNLLTALGAGALGKGTIPRSQAESLALLQSTGQAIMFDNGPIRWSPMLNKQLAIGLNSKGQRIAPQGEDVTNAMRSLVQAFAKKNETPAEDVYITTRGDQIEFYAFDASTGVAVAKRNFTVTAFNDEMARLRKISDTEAASTRTKTPVGAVNTRGGKFVITDGWSAIPFGKELAANLVKFEGFVPDWKNTRSAKDQLNPKLTQTEVIGIGISKKHHPKWVPKFDAAKGDPNKMGALTAEFAQSFYRDIDQKAQVYGLDLRQPMTKQTALAFMDAHWHGNQKQYGAALRAPDVEYAIAVLQDQPIYKQAQPERRQFYVNGLVQFFRAKGQLNFKNMVENTKVLPRKGS